MRRGTLNLAAGMVFVLILLSFLVRGTGQFLVGPDRVKFLVSPLLFLALALLAVVVAAWTLDRLGVVTIEEE
jgi:hypothetical protein